MAAEATSAQVAALQVELRMTREALAEHRERVHESNKTTTSALIEIQKEQRAHRDAIKELQVETATNRRWLRGLGYGVPVVGSAIAFMKAKGWL